MRHRLAGISADLTVEELADRTTSPAPSTATPSWAQKPCCYALGVGQTTLLLRKPMLLQPDGISVTAFQLLSASVGVACSIHREALRVVGWLRKACAKDGLSAVRRDFHNLPNVRSGALVFCDEEIARRVHRHAGGKKRSVPGVNRGLCGRAKAVTGPMPTP